MNCNVFFPTGENNCESSTLKHFLYLSIHVSVNYFSFVKESYRLVFNQNSGRPCLAKLDYCAFTLIQQALVYLISYLKKCWNQFTQETLLYFVRQCSWAFTSLFRFYNICIIKISTLVKQLISTIYMFLSLTRSSWNHTERELGGTTKWQKFCRHRSSRPLHAVPPGCLRPPHLCRWRLPAEPERSSEDTMPGWQTSPSRIHEGRKGLHPGYVELLFNEFHSNFYLKSTISLNDEAKHSLCMCAADQKPDVRQPFTVIQLTFFLSYLTKRKKLSTLNWLIYF